MAVRNNRPTAIGCVAEFRCCNLLLAGRRLSRRVPWRCVDAVPDDHAVALLRRWRLCGGWAVCCGSVAIRIARERNGLRLRSRQLRQGAGAVGAGVDCGFVELREPEG